MSSSTGQRPPIESGVERAHRLGDVARNQHGVFTRSQAVEAGYTMAMIDRRVRAGEWVRAGRSVLATAHAPITYRRAVMAAVLSIDGAVASHEAAAAMAWQKLDRVNVHRYHDLSPEWITSRHGIPLTTPARTLIDLGAVLRAPRLELVLDAALDHNQVNLAELTRAFNRLARKGRRGIAPMRRLLEARGDGIAETRSELERRFLKFVRLHHLPEPAKQLPTFWDDRLIGLADFAYAEWRLLVELDGRLGHTQLVDSDLDLLRDQRAIAADWRVIRVTWRQLRDRPDQVLDVLEAVFRRDAA
jgi:hypothetical protein